MAATQALIIGTYSVISDGGPLLSGVRATTPQGGSVLVTNLTGSLTATVMTDSFDGTVIFGPSALTYTAGSPDSWNVAAAAAVIPHGKPIYVKVGVYNLSGNTLHHTILMFLSPPGGA